MAKKSKTLRPVGRVSGESVLKGSGRDWDQWINLLQKAGAESWTHQEMVAFLKKKYKLIPWWQQGVAYGFQVATGRRADGQNLKGLYSVTATGTFPINNRELWKLLCSSEGLEAWLKPLSPFPLEVGQSYECEGGVYGEVRTMKSPVRVRLSWREEDWPKNSSVQIYVGHREGKKSMLAIMHEGLTTALQREQLRTRWKQGILDLKALLDG